MTTDEGYLTYLLTKGKRKGEMASVAVARGLCVCCDVSPSLPFRARNLFSQPSRAPPVHITHSPSRLFHRIFHHTTSTFLSNRRQHRTLLCFFTSRDTQSIIALYCSKLLITPVTPPPFLLNTASCTRRPPCLHRSTARQTSSRRSRMSTRSSSSMASSKPFPMERSQQYVSSTTPHSARWIVC